MDVSIFLKMIDFENGRVHFRNGRVYFFSKMDASIFFQKWTRPFSKWTRPFHRPETFARKISICFYLKFTSKEGVCQSDTKDNKINVSCMRKESMCYQIPKIIKKT